MGLPEGRKKREILSLPDVKVRLAGGDDGVRRRIGRGDFGSSATALDAKRPGKIIAVAELAEAERRREAITGEKNYVGETCRHSR